MTWLNAPGLRNHGAKPKYHHEAVGGNFRLDEMQAAFLRVKRTQLKGWIDRRITNAAQYRKQLENVPDLILPQEDVGHTWNQFTIRLENRERRDALASRLREAGIGHEFIIPKPSMFSPVLPRISPPLPSGRVTQWASFESADLSRAAPHPNRRGVQPD